MADQHIVHEHESAHVYQHVDETPRVSVALETHGAPGTDKHYVTWTVKATAPTVAEALALVQEADTQLRAQCGVAE